VHWSAPVMTVGLDGAAVENDLSSGRLGCPAVGCGGALGPWGWARERIVRGAGRLLPRRGRCRGCRRTQVLLPAVTLEWKIPQHGSNTIERNRARSYFQAYAAACALHFAEKALAEIRAGHTKTWEKFDVPEQAISCGFTDAVRGVLSHHMVIRDGKIANYHPYPPTPWNASPRDSYGTPGPYEDAVEDQPIFQENDRDHFKGIDIMRTVRSFDPCRPCGVHMYLGDAKTLDKLHSPTMAAQSE
jgi:hydrogenase large subunit